MPQQKPWEKYAQPSGPVFTDPTQPYKAPQAEADLRFKGVSTDNVRDEIRNRTATLDNTVSNQRISNASAMRDDFNKMPEVTAYTQALPAYVSGLKSAPNGAGDLKLIYSFAKIMDPMTGVREGEADSVGTGQSVFAQTVERLKKNLGQGGVFSPDYRKQLRAEMAQTVSELNNGYLNQRVRFKEQAVRNKIDPRDVVGDHIGVRFTPEIERLTGRKMPTADWYGNQMQDNSPVPPAMGGGPNKGPDPRLYGGAAEGYAAPAPESVLNATSKSVPSEAKRKAYGDLIGFLNTNPDEARVREFVAGNPIYTPGFADELIKYHQVAKKWAASPGDLSDQVPLSANEIDRNFDQARPDTVFMKNFSNDMVGGLPRALATSSLMDPDGTRAAGINAADATHPNYAIGGKLAGTVVGALGSEGIALKALTKIGMPAAAAVAPRVADTAFSAITGATGDPEHPGMGALKGAIMGLGGGEVGRGIPSAISPTGGKFADFYAAGGRPTLGQRFGQSGPIGRGLNTFEQATGSVPLTGAFTRGARGETVDQWKRVGFDNALGEFGDKLPKDVPVGPGAFKYTGQKFDDIYGQALGGMRFSPDGQYASEFGNFQRNTLGSGILDGDTTTQLNKIITNTVGSRMRNGELSGPAFKKASSTLRTIAQKTTKPELSDAVREYRNIFMDAARRNSDPNAVSLLDKADAGWAQYKPLTLAGRRAGSDPGDFTPTGLAAVERNANKRSRAYLEGESKLGDFVNLGKSLEDTLPNSGTADRWATGALMGGSGMANPSIPLAALAVPALNSPLFSGIVKGALAPRGGIPGTVAEALRKRQSMLGAAGVAGGPALLQYYGIGQ